MIAKSNSATFRTPKGFDVTGEKKLGGRNGTKKATGFDNEAANLQRRACVALYRMIKSRGQSSEDAAMDIGYTRVTLDTWERIFYGDTVKASK